MPSEDPLSLLTALPTPRVWSMLVTIFGDLAQDSENLIDGRLLVALADGMGIKPEAVRVALHRLRNDDWITSQKAGRTARHALTPYGRRESQTASRLIYARVRELPQNWQLALTQDNETRTREAMSARHFLQIAPRIYVAHADCPVPPGAIVCQGDQAPGWFQAEVTADTVSIQFDNLAQTVRRVADSLNRAPVDTPLQIALLRCLIVHHWRRLALRHPYLPPALTGSDWAGHRCRDAVADVLNLLPRPLLSDLQKL